MEDNLLIIRINHEEKSIALKVVYKACYTKNDNDKIVERDIPVNIRNIVNYIIDIVSDYPDYYLVKEEKNNG